jgi:hypothetical protein
MRDFKIEPLSRSIIQSIYEKRDFSNDLTEKAYLIGFRLGDLNVYQTSKNSEVIIVRCHTTTKEQIELMQRLFGKYGKVSVSENKKDKSYHINCFLNKSFLFLLPKEDAVKEWISNNNECSSAFAAGYTDAEGNIGIYDGRARFKIDAYDKNIIKWFYRWFCNNEIICPAPKKIGTKNQVYNITLGYKYNKDLWRIRVSKTYSLLIMFNLIKPYLKHKQRIKDLENCIKNIYDRDNKKRERR